jgi:shikimate kinase
MADRYPGMIFVYGPPGSGKSTVGAALAQALELPFSDLDAEVENAAGRSIAAIFQEEGEPAFRRLEREALLNTLSMNGERVVALGGGALLDPDLRERVIDAGRVLLLGGAMPVLKQRVLSMADQRPLLHGDAAARLESLLAEREAHYASFPLQVDTSGKEVEKVAWEAQVALGRFRVRGMGLGYDVRVRPGGLDRGGGPPGGSPPRGPTAGRGQLHRASSPGQRQQRRAAVR